MLTTPKKKIVLKSSNGTIFEVEEAVAIQSETIAHMIEDDCVANGIPLSNVTSEILSLVIEYCKKHVDGDGSSSQEDLKNWDAEFINGLDSSTIFHLIMAANFLNVKSLLDLTCQTVADTMIRGKTVDEIRKTLNIENDFTPEEEAHIRQENQWALDLNDDVDHLG